MFGSLVDIGIIIKHCRSIYLIAFVRSHIALNIHLTCGVISLVIYLIEEKLLCKTCEF